MVTRYKSVRDDVLCEVDRKVRQIKEKNVLKHFIREAPPHTGEMLAGVNIF